MDRKRFLTECWSCGALSFLGLLRSDKVNAQEKSIKKSNIDGEKINKNQIQQLLKFIDSSINKKDRERIFNKLGYECLYSRNYDKWILSFKDKQDEFFNRVKRGESKYWEKLEYDKKNSVITLTGKKFQSCVCEFSQCIEPPKSLCKYISRLHTTLPVTGIKPLSPGR